MSVEESTRVTIKNDPSPILEELYRTKDWTDLTIKLGDKKSIQVHKCIITSIPYFAAMFTSDMKESKQNEIIIKENLDPEMFETAIQFAYSRQIEVESEDIESLLVVAGFFQFSKLLSACCECLSKSLSVENVFQMKTLADTIGSHDFSRQIYLLINQNSPSLLESPHFLALSHDDIGRMINSRSPTDHSEFNSFNALIKWVEHDADARRQHFRDLFSRIHLGLIHCEDIMNVVLTEDLVLEDKECVQEALVIVKDILRLRRPWGRLNGPRNNDGDHRPQVRLRGWPHVDDQIEWPPLAPNYNDRPEEIDDDW